MILSFCFFLHGKKTRVMPSGVEKMSRSSDEEWRKKLTDEERKRQDAEQRLHIAEKTIVSQRKEILMLQRQLGSPRTAGSLRTEKVSSAPNSGKDDAVVDQERVHVLQQENADLLSCLKKQNRLIDVLKRQKILLEAGTLLALSEKEFSQHLELERV